jgi:hypothetical protein
MPTCAFLTIADRDGWFIDDELVHEPLRQLGWDITDIPWTDETDWGQWDLIVIRSTWDYQADVSRYLEVLTRIDRSGAVLLNSLATVRWNLQKSYLFELQKRGIEIIPTQRFSGVTISDLRDAEASMKSDTWIMKPILGANADNTFRLRRGTPDGQLAELCGRFRTADCLVQPFVSSVVTEGEYSVIYFDGQVSHTIIKKVRKGDFRVQEEHGGSVVPLPRPEKELIAAADKVMDVLDEVPLYARVDLVRTPENRFALMELELIEPSLYFRFCEDSPMKFAEAIDRRFQAESGRPGL